MFNPETNRIAQSRNVIWLGREHHTRQDADLMQQLPIVTVPISIFDASVDAEIQKLEVATFPLSEERGVESNSSSEKANEWIVAKKDMVVQLEERIVHTTQAQELSSSGVMWWQLKLMTFRIRWQTTMRY
jgi:hypothetical protein